MVEVVVMLFFTEAASSPAAMRAIVPTAVRRIIKLLPKAKLVPAAGAMPEKESTLSKHICRYLFGRVRIPICTRISQTGV